MPGKPLNLGGRRWGLITAVEDVGSRPRVGRLWRCKCDCGKERIASALELNKGDVTRCGTDCPLGGGVSPGSQYGRLMVRGKMARQYLADAQRSEWACECECGMWIVASGESLKAGTTQSCGCIRRKRESQ